MATVWSSNVTSLQAEQHGTQLVCVCKKKEKKRNNSPALPIFTILHKQHLDLHAYLFDYIYWNGTKSARLWILRHCCDRFQRRYANKEQLWFWVVLKSSFLSLPHVTFNFPHKGLMGRIAGSDRVTRMRRYSSNLYQELAEELDMSTGFVQNGGACAKYI